MKGRAGTVYAAHPWRTNGHLIASLVPLGYLWQDADVLDPTYGNGRWWKVWRPDRLTCHDLAQDGVDFRHLPYDEATFDVEALDGPYKLNGSGGGPADEQYGVHVRASWQQRHDLICGGIIEAYRVLKPRGFLLLKCQDQVSGGKVRWQTIEFSTFAMGMGFRLVDRFDMLTRSRKQPPRTRKAKRGEASEDGRVPSVQQHARRNYSTLLVLQKPPKGHLAWRNT